ncbi:MAG TPA: nickel pincer cofactor biosynthesis protein LarB [Acetobacteraceae bacterium]|nr:nickel pincer cofactor biosynthesis protein LarB [Acetobacteraceae bacterium]
MSEFVFDAERERRIGLPEAVFCAGKSAAQIAAIIEQAEQRGQPLLLTRLDAERFAALPPDLRMRLDRDEMSATAYASTLPPLSRPPRVAVVTAGTSDLPVAAEAVRTLRFHGEDALRVADVGVAGLWRLLARVEELRAMRVVIVAAGMDAALPSVVAGLVPGAVIGVPTSVGYGVASGGQTALHAMLASCAPGLVVVNIDNGYGAACAALRALAAGIT